MQDEMNEETIVYVVQLINELMRGGPHRVAVFLYARSGSVYFPFKISKPFLYSIMHVRSVNINMPQGEGQQGVDFSWFGSWSVRNFLRFFFRKSLATVKRSIFCRCLWINF